MEYDEAPKPPRSKTTVACERLIAVREELTRSYFAHLDERCLLFIKSVNPYRAETLREDDFHRECAAGQIGMCASDLELLNRAFQHVVRVPGDWWVEGALFVIPMALLTLRYDPAFFSNEIVSTTSEVLFPQIEHGQVALHRLEGRRGTFDTTVSHVRQLCQEDWADHRRDVYARH
jgi:hypothetical protein